MMAPIEVVLVMIEVVLAPIEAPIAVDARSEQLRGGVIETKSRG